jgi:hypothetical protein
MTDSKPVSPLPVDLANEYGHILNSLPTARVKVTCREIQRLIYRIGLLEATVKRKWKKATTK